jgi:hypothetical protein
MAYVWFVCRVADFLSMNCIRVRTGVSSPGSVLQHELVATNVGMSACSLGITLLAFLVSILICIH